MPPVSILGVEFYPVTFGGACSAIDWMLSVVDGCTRLVVTANPIMIVRASRDPEFMAILRGADLLVPDGVGILWAAKKMGASLPERVTGVDLAYRLLGKQGLRVFLLGGRPGVAERATARVQAQNPGAAVCGFYHGYFGTAEEDKVVEMVRRSNADLLLVGMGSPRQEKFIWRNRRNLGARVAMGVGGVLDVLAGDVRRAPSRVQELGLEWLYRLVRQPRRLLADLALVEFALRVEIEALRRKKRSREGMRQDAGDELAG